MKNMGSLLLVYRPRYVDHVIPRVSILNLGLRASVASLSICDPVWREMFPLLKERVNLNPLSQTCPPQPPLNSPFALPLPGSYHFQRGESPTIPKGTGPFPGRPFRRNAGPMKPCRSN